MIQDIKQNPISSRIELADQIIAKIFDIARKKIEGINRRVSYSIEKAKARECIAIQKAVIRKLNNKAINKQKLQTQMKKQHANIEEIQALLDVQEKLSAAKNQWSIVK